MCSTELELTDDEVRCAATPQVKRSEDKVIEGEESQLMDPAGAIRLGTVLLLYLGQDRADIQEATTFTQTCSTN